MPTFPSRGSRELKDVIVQATFEGISRLDTTISPYPTLRKLHTYTFNIADLFHLLTVAWAVACVVIVRYSQAQPFPFLPILETTILFAIGLSIPLFSQFLVPATQVIVYLWTLYWFHFLPPSISISFPFHLTLFSYPLLSVFLWLFGPRYSLPHFSRLTGYTNLMVATTFIALRATCFPGARPLLTYEGLFVGLNTGLQLIFMKCFFPQQTLVAGTFLIISVLHGGLQDPSGFVVGVITSAASFLCLSPEDGKNHEAFSLTPSSLTASKTPEDKEAGTYHELPNILSTPVLPPVAGVDALATHTEHDAVRNRTRPSTPAPSTPTTVPVSAAAPLLPPGESFANIQAENVGLVAQSSLINGDGAEGGALETFEQSSPVRRRHSVIGPRERTKTATRPMSLDVSFGRRPLPTPPSGSTQSTTTTSTRNSSHLSSPEVQARWNDDLFEVSERLGESSSRVAYKVRERRSGLVFVRKTFYPRQTSGHHIVLSLLSLIDHQDNRDASSHLVRCYGAYLPNGANEGVRGIFEFCEGGSLQAIGSNIARRGGIVGEKIAGRIATGVSASHAIKTNLNSVIRCCKVLATFTV